MLCVVLLQEGGLHLELEFVQCELMVKSLMEKQETYQKTVVDVSTQRSVHLLLLINIKSHSQMGIQLVIYR